MAFHAEHPESTRLEARAAGDLAPSEAQAVDAHLEGCARCRSEFEAWELLFGELGHLPRPTPSPDFAARVMARVEVRAPFRHRAADAVFGTLRSLRLLPGARGGASREPSAHPVPQLEPRPGVRHLTPAGIQDYLDGLLATRTGHRVEAHLATCRSCRREMEGWQTLVTELQHLPRLSPPVGFADRVMDRVEVAAVAQVTRTEASRPGLATRIWGHLGRLVPSSRGGRVVASGLALAPAVGVVAAVSAVLLHPLVSFVDLVTFLRWQLLDAASGFSAAAFARVAESTFGQGLVDSAAAAAQASPTALAGVAFLAAFLVGTATFVVYRNLIAPSLRGENHVQPTS
jgi:anti-sigma factor RsiW